MDQGQEAEKLRKEEMERELNILRAQGDSGWSRCARETNAKLEFRRKWHDATWDYALLERSNSELREELETARHTNAVLTEMLGVAGGGNRKGGKGSAGQEEDGNVQFAPVVVPAVQPGWPAPVVQPAAGRGGQTGKGGASHGAQGPGCVLRPAGMP